MHILKSRVFLIGLGGTLFLLLFLLTLFSFLSLKKDTQVVPQKVLPTQIPAFIVQPTFPQNLPKGDKIKISSVTMNNFYVSPVEILQNDVLIKNSPDFSMYFLGNFKTFLISINASPFDVVRIKAEDAFLTQLGISQSDACKLNVEITTEYKINPDQSGIRFPLRFCENSKQ